MERSIFCGAHLDGANFTNAHLQRAHLEGGHFLFTHLEEADLSNAHLEGVYLDKAHLEGKAMPTEVVAHLRQELGIDYFPEVAFPANLSGVFFDSATKLRGTILGDDKYGFVSLADVSGGNINLTVIDWAKVNMLGDERIARQQLWNDGKIKDKEILLLQHHCAVRANRQLAVALQAQGMNEQAARFAYRAQRLQRIIFRRQRKLGPYFCSGFLDLLAGYGYRPVRSVFIYLLVIFGYLPILPDSLVFSLTSFHGRGFFPGLGNQTALHNPLVVLASLEAIVGLMVEISFIATFTQRFFGR